jgi:hypothetical protein
MSFDPVSAVLDIGGKLIDRIWPNQAERDAARLKMLELAHNGELAKLAADTDIAKVRGDIVKAEAQSESWLTRSWRPITMLTFVGLIVARMLGYSAANVSEAEYMKLWELMEVGLGGYVVGRSAMQIAQVIAPAIASSVKK